MDAKKNRPFLRREKLTLKHHGQGRTEGRHHDHDAHQTVDAVHETFNENDRHGDAQQSRDGHAETEANRPGSKHVHQNAHGVRGKAHEAHGAKPGRRHRFGCVQNLHNANAADKVGQGGNHKQNFAQSHLRVIPKRKTARLKGCFSNTETDGAVL